MWKQRLTSLLRRLKAPATSGTPEPSLTSQRLYNPLLHGEVSLDACAVHLTRRNGDNASIAFDDIDFITADRLGGPDGVCWLNLSSFSKAPASIPSVAKGFEHLQPFLERLSGFDLARWQALCQSSEPEQQVLLWRRDADDDFVISTDTVHGADGFNRGIYLDDCRQWLPWDTYETLGKLSFVNTHPERYPNPDFSGLRYEIRRPTIANGLKLPRLYTLTDAARGAPKLHLPVLCWQADIRLGRTPVMAFDRIREHLDRYLGSSDMPITQHEPGMTLEGRWERERVTVSLRCFYRDEIKGWDNIAWLRIEHDPDVSRFYRSDYGERLTPGPTLTWQRFPVTLNVDANYRNVDNALFTPACFKDAFDEKHGMVIWVDHASPLLGIANENFALTFDTRHCHSLILSVRRFRGDEAGNALELNTTEGVITVGSVTDVGDFEREMKAITQLTGVETNQCVIDEYY